MKELPVVWNVFRDDWNARKIQRYNIFEHTSFMIDCADEIKKHKSEYFQLEIRIRRTLMYYFWSKCEMEIIISDFPNGKIEEKVDVYSQVMMNWDVFYAYFWEHRAEIQKIGEEWKRRWRTR